MLSYHSESTGVNNTINLMMAAFTEKQFQGPDIIVYAGPLVRAGL